MGWWKVEGTQTVLGDGPLDVLTSAVAAVAADYQSKFNRRPTKAEWEALLLAVLGGEEPEARSSDEGIATSIHVTMKPNG